VSEPKTTDYCANCGESPESGSHLPHGHEYVDPRPPVAPKEDLYLRTPPLTDEEWDHVQEVAELQGPAGLQRKLVAQHQDLRVRYQKACEDIEALKVARGMDRIHLVQTMAQTERAVTLAEQGAENSERAVAQAERFKAELDDAKRLIGIYEKSYVTKFSLDCCLQALNEKEAEIEVLKLRPPMACSTCEDLNLELADELEAIRPVYAIAKGMRTFPVPFDAHIALVDAVDYARQRLEPPDQTEEEIEAEFQDLMRSMSRCSPCECTEWPHAPFCPARRAD
jgi:hypothetical protein